MGFALLLVAITVVGVTLIIFARGSYRAAAVSSPKVNLPGSPGDHFHNAFGIYLCDKFIEPLSDAGPDTTGIHSHADGLIHIHPYLQSSSGGNAQMGKFFEMVGLEATGQKVVLPAGSTEKKKTWQSGKDTCNVGDKAKKKTEKGQWVLLEYPPQAGPETVPTVHKEGFDGLSIRTDGQAWTMAFLPASQVDSVASKRKGDLLPPSMEELKNPSDQLEPDGSGAPGSGDQGVVPPVTGESVPAPIKPPTDAAPTDAAPSTAAPTEKAPATSAAG